MEEPIYDVTLSHVAYTYPETELPVFMDLSLALPRGMVSLVGQNGTGKSTVLLLAGGRIYPGLGTVRILGRDSRELVDENEKNRYVSFIYQNMEFETEESIGDLMEWVYEHGHNEGRDPSLLNVLSKTLELEGILRKRTQAVSKGELQRAIIAFSLLYGSRIIMMDEPIFALEYGQKVRVMGFLMEYARERAISIYYFPEILGVGAPLLQRPADSHRSDRRNAHACEPRRSLRNSLRDALPKGVPLSRSPRRSEAAKSLRPSRPLFPAKGPYDQRRGQEAKALIAREIRVADRVGKGLEDHCALDLPGSLGGAHPSPAFAARGLKRRQHPLGGKREEESFGDLAEPRAAR